MEEIFQQIGALLLGATPTILLFVALVLAYQFLVQGPLTRALAERRARTEGAIENAHKAISRAEARAAEYAENLRQARAEIFKMREARDKQRSAEREVALDVARKAAGVRVSQARSEMDSEVESARQVIQGAAGELANQVVRAVLPQATGSSR
jgi:F-type H+-transporting ATPase subunit b